MAKNIFLYALLTILTASHCQKTKAPNPNPHHQTTSHSPRACQFYRIQSLIINCHAKYNFFGHVGKQQNTIGTGCAKQAFSSVWGTNFTPTAHTNNRETSGLHWWFQLGNIQKTNLPQPPHYLEIEYQNLQRAFYGYVDANRLNTCLGGNYPFNVEVIISTSFEMIKLGNLTPATFTKCYRNELELYRKTNFCPAL